MREEVGHAFGLDHKDPNDADSGMNQNFSLRRWDTHDKSHVNGGIDMTKPVGCSRGFHLRPTRTVLLLTVVAALIMGLWWAALSTADGQSPDWPLLDSQAREFYDFASIDTLVSTSDVVGIFRVRAARGEAVSGQGGPFSVTIAELEVQEVLLGNPDLKNLSVVVDDTYRPETVTGTERDWLRTGRTVALALHRRTDTGDYRPTNSQSIFLLDGSSRVRGVFNSRLVRSVEGMEFAAFRQALFSAAERAKAGLVTPVPPARTSASG